MAEVQADKDLQRAEFAMSTRRLETTVEQLRTRGAGQLAELGRKGDAINRAMLPTVPSTPRLSSALRCFRVSFLHPVNSVSPPSSLIVLLGHREYRNLSRPL